MKLLVPGDNYGRRSRGHGGTGMATYVTLVSWTDQGIRNFRESAQRAGDFARLAEGAGGRVREQLWTVGEYDMVCVVEFPDDETGAAAILRAGAAGNIRTRTMRAFGADEMIEITRRAAAGG
jgi:uncharacterized protein with GYD domain